ncbi:MAG: amidinotransferase [Deltaproteobacteria bacterium]|nr:amidinotransferase [Deltaproteobacteria bacterium]MDQ3299871.1 arginine deiminase-related protein [Myxococcota bacterium]
MRSFIASDVCCGSLHPRTAACAYQVAWSINPHMIIGSADPVRAQHQHAALIRTVRELGAHVSMLPFVHGAFDCVFAKDNAVYVHTQGRASALLASPRHAVRRAEQRSRARDLRRAGMHVHAIAAPFEGGDVHVLPAGRGAILGHGFRSSPEAIRPLRELTRVPVFPLELVDPALYHLDTALTVLADGTALVCDEAFSPASRRAMRCLPLRDIITISRSETTRFALNVVEIDGTVVTGTDSPEVTDVLRSLGKRVVHTPLDEFQRAGGSAACLLAPVHGADQATVAQAATAAIRSTAA